MPPPKLSVFIRRQYLLEQLSPMFCQAKSPPVSTTTQSHALEGEAQASKAMQAH